MLEPGEACMVECRERRVFLFCRPGRDQAKREGGRWRKRCMCARGCTRRWREWRPCERPHQADKRDEWSGECR